MKPRSVAVVVDSWLRGGPILESIQSLALVIYGELLEDGSQGVRGCG